MENNNNNIDSFDEFEHNDGDGLEYTLLREIESSKEYAKFRKHYSEEIKNVSNENDGRFVMTHQMTNNIITDVTEIIKKLGYGIIKK